MSEDAGPTRDSFGPSATLADIVGSLACRGEQAALLSVKGEATEPLSYAALAERVAGLAGGMVAAGVRPGEPIILFGPNSADWVVVRLAIAMSGAVAVAFDDLLTDAELATLVPDSGAERGFVAADHISRLRALPDGGALLLWRLDGDPAADRCGVQHYTALTAGAKPGAALPALKPEDPAMLVYTSGTTGTPKSFILTHGNLLANVRALTVQQIVRSHDRALLPLPLHHVYPLTVGCLTALASGTTIVLPEAVTGPQLVAALRAGRVTVMVGVPRLYTALIGGLEQRIAGRGPTAARLFRAMLGFSIGMRRRFGVRIGRRLFGALHRQLAPDLWLMASGGAKIEAELIWKLEGLGWQVLSGYGLAETASILTNNHRNRARIGSEGWVLEGSEIRIADPDADGIGEIQARGPPVFAGYRNNPEANAEAFTADGWFRTGDFGTIDEDGYLHVVGRVKEMIVLGGGKNIFPDEIEKVYSDSPYISEIAVLERAGSLVALVVPDVDAIVASGNRRVEDVLRVTLTERSRLLASFQRIAGFAISREPLPRTRLGKYQRFRLPELYGRAERGAPAKAAPLGEEDRALLDSSPAREIWSWLKTRYPDRDLSLDQSPQLDLGIDSLGWVTLSLELAERFDVRISEEDAAEIFTLRDLLQRAGARVGEGAAAAAAELDQEQRVWLERPGPALRLLGRVLYAANRVLIRGFFGLRVTGREKVPTRGPFVLVSNHLSDLDPLVLAAAFDFRRVDGLWWCGEAGRLFRDRRGRLLARIAHIFPAEERTPATTLAYGHEILARGECLAWFPEAWRSPTGELQNFLPGIGRLLVRDPVPAVPARIAGTYEALPRDRRLPRLTRLQIAFGEPLDTEALVAEAPPDAAAARLTEALHAAVAALPGRRA